GVRNRLREPHIQRACEISSREPPSKNYDELFRIAEFAQVPTCFSIRIIQRSPSIGIDTLNMLTDRIVLLVPQSLILNPSGGRGARVMRPDHASHGISRPRRSRVL